MYGGCLLCSLYPLLVYSNTSIIIIRTLYVSNINTDCVQLFDSLFHTPPQANYNSVCSPRSIIHLLRQVKLIGKSGQLNWELRLYTENNSATDCWNERFKTQIVCRGMDRLQCVHDPQQSME